MIWLLAVWRNTPVKRTTGMAPLVIMSASTWPGPTEGNWSTSPTTSRAAAFGIALSSACISSTSTIDVSSMTSRSQSRGFSLSRRKPPVRGSTSSSRWMLLASKPVTSFMRLAARPVGAHARAYALCREDAQDGVDDGGLAHARASGDHPHLGGERQRHGRSLAFGKDQAGALLDPGNRLLRINPGPGQFAGPKLQQPRCRVPPGTGRPGKRKACRRPCRQ